MNTRQKFTIQSLVAIVLVNGVLIAGFLFLAGEAASGFLVALLILGAILTLALWLIIRQFGISAIQNAAASAVPAPPPSKPEPVTPKPVRRELPEARETAAVQILSILQRRGRLIDFLQEDLNQYEDAQIGAAVRSVHEGCKQALQEHVELEPIVDQQEGSVVTLQKGFDANAVRLIGDVVGEPPFRGALRHHGWKIKRIDLPERVQGGDKEMIVAAAEVEV